MVVSPTFIFAKEEAPPKNSMERRQRAELMQFFLGNPQEAVLPTSPIAVELYNRAVEYFRKSDYALARQMLNESLGHDDKNSFAHELLGDISSAEHKLDEAAEHYGAAYRLRPEEGIRKKIRKLKEELAVEGKLSQIETEYFVLRYEKDSVPGESFAYKDLLSKVYEQVSKDLDYNFHEKMVVLIYGEEDFNRITQMPHWVTGLYDGKVRMPVRLQGAGDSEMEALATHEMTHAFIAALSAHRAPAWVNEGLAQVEENKIRPIDLLVFDAAVTTRTLLPLDQLMIPQEAVAHHDPLWANLFYQQSYHLVQYLVNQYGIFKMRKLLEAFAAEKNSDEAVRSVYGVSIEELEKAWRATFTPLSV